MKWSAAPGTSSSFSFGGQVLPCREWSGTMAIAMGSRVLASPSFLASKEGALGTKAGSSPLSRPFSSLELRHGSQKQIGPSSILRTLKSGNPGVAAITPPKLATSRWSTRVRSALQADTIRDKSELKQTVEKLKELVDLAGGNSKVADDRELLRFLRAKSLDIEATAKAFADHQKWKAEFVPKGYFTEAEVQAELDSNKAYFIKEDKKGRPALLTFGRNHVYNKNDFEEFKRAIVYFFETLIREAPPDAEQFICILDLKGLGIKNLDSKSFIAAAEILQTHYPQRVEKVFMINVPIIFNGLWKVVKPFLEEDIRNRVMFVDKKKTAEILTSEIDAEYLPRECGGTADLIPLQDVGSRT